MAKRKKKPPPPKPKAELLEELAEARKELRSEIAAVRFVLNEALDECDARLNELDKAFEPLVGHLPDDQVAEDV